MSEEQTVKCPICGEPYVVISYMVGDQSACPKCREKARKKMKVNYNKWEQNRG